MNASGCTLLFAMTLMATFFGCNNKPASAEQKVESPHIVFVTGDEEYRSEESMPMLARIAARELGAQVSVCYSLDSAGFIDPNNTESITGLEALEDADLMVLFTRFRKLPAAQRDFITAYAESGRPMVGFRTATHAFSYEDSTASFYNDIWPTRVFGQQWIVHHGHFEDGHDPLTSVTKPAETSHPILRGVDDFDAYSWLYHVDGGEWKLYGDSKPILNGHSLRSKQEANGKLADYPLDQPVAWTKTYTGASGQAARVFFTTLGHPYDFKLEAMRRLAMQGVYWALNRENEIPASGINVEPEGTYSPNNSGFGMKFKQGLAPTLMPQ